ncbi:hydrogenase [Azospirillum sp. RWY-5-1]|uniref:Hydrogenase expression/formation protein n=1 Tax=Azospirillum oleiclasticum TaxID=2735135 RepID=A0ABX2T5M8_9PROT|nr:hydrogenase [Azospirillum oleiclasticum]NYZ12462.1 hydrogenase [Azospirillum oleiclasticum]NYZ19622.1 hydrogenase [Azospirillum oleiclasticum]
MAHAHPLPPLVDRLLTVHGYPLLETGAEALAEDAEGVRVVFLPGHGKGSGETADIAVILPELVKAAPVPLTAAVAGPQAEAALVARVGTLGLPALVFLHRGEVLGSIPRVRDWSDYLARIRSFLAVPADRLQ